MAENQKEYEKTIPKIIVVGPGRVDKTSFIRKVIKNFSENELDLKKMNIFIIIIEKKLKFLYTIYLHLMPFQYIKTL